MENNVLKYPGSKWRIAADLVKLIPAHHSYLEPFFGSGAIFFKKEPSRIETINDLDNEVVNLFKCIKNDPNRLADLVYQTPYSRTMYNEAYEDREYENEYDKSLAFLTRCWQGYGYRTNGKVGWKSDVQGRERAYAVRDWNRLPGRVIEVAERLKQVQIENRPAIEVIRRFNYQNVFMYLDPPYILNSRSGGRKQYKNEMTDREHEELLKELLSSRAKIMISGYESEMYNDYLHNWEKRTFSSQAQQGKARQEVVWMNYEIDKQMRLEL